MPTRASAASTRHPQTHSRAALKRHSVTAHAAVRAPWTLRGGASRPHKLRDVVSFTGGAAGSRLDGGTGTDTLRYTRDHLNIGPRAHVIFDLARGVLRDLRSEQVTNRRAVDFEDATVWHANGPTTLKGTAGPNRLSTHRGHEKDTYAVIYGRTGNDRLSAGGGDDVLI